MSLEIPFARTTDETPSMPVRETSTVPTLLPACCVCGLIRDDTRCSTGRDRWVTRRKYREVHGVHPAEHVLTHTYCPECYTKAREAILQYFRQTGVSL